MFVRYLAALLTCSNLSMFLCVWGSHTVEQYASVDLTNVLYAICLMSCVQPCRFLLKNPSEQFALEHMESICVLNFKFVVRWTPRYLYLLTDSNCEL